MNAFDRDDKVFKLQQEINKLRLLQQENNNQDNDESNIFMDDTYLEQLSDKNIENKYKKDQIEKLLELMDFIDIIISDPSISKTQLREANFQRDNINNIIKGLKE